MAIRLKMLKKTVTPGMPRRSSPRDAAKPSKTIRTVQKLAEQLSFESLKDDLTRQQNDLRRERQRRIDDSEAENQQLRQTSKVQLTDQANVGTGAELAKPAETVKRDYSNITCVTCGQKDRTSNVYWKKNGQKSDQIPDNANVMTPLEERASVFQER